MYSEAYREWIGIFNDDLLEIWQNQRKELQKAAMLLTALQKELKDVQTNLEVELINLQQQLKYKDNLEERRKSWSPKNKKRKSPKSVNNENEYIDSEVVDRPLEHSFIFNQKPEGESPDLFKNINPNIQRSPADTSIIDLSLSDEDIAVDGSPTIKRRKRHYHRSKINSPSVNCNINSIKTEDTTTNKILTKNSGKVSLFKTPTLKSDDDFSVIENTPDVTSEKSSIISKVGGFSLRRMGRNRATANNTLTQMFGKAKKKLQMNENKRIEDDTDSDETYFHETTEGSKMGITDMLSYINKDGTTINEEKSVIDARTNDELTDCELYVDSSQEVDQFSKGAIFNEDDVATSSEKPKLLPLEPEPVVRGKARKQLHGWACEKCKNFYGQMNLSPEELQKKMDECSRHRYRYQPPDETLPACSISIASKRALKFPAANPPEEIKIYVL